MLVVPSLFATSMSFYRVLHVLSILLWCVCLFAGSHFCMYLWKWSVFCVCMCFLHRAGVWQCLSWAFVSAFSHDWLGACGFTCTRVLLSGPCPLFPCPRLFPASSSGLVPLSCACVMMLFSTSVVSFCFVISSPCVRAHMHTSIYVSIHDSYTYTLIVSACVCVCVVCVCVCVCVHPWQWGR